MGRAGTKKKKTARGNGKPGHAGGRKRTVTAAVLVCLCAALALALVLIRPWQRRLQPPEEDRRRTVFPRGREATLS